MKLFFFSKWLLAWLWSAFRLGSWGLAIWHHIGDNLQELIWNALTYPQQHCINLHIQNKIVWTCLFPKHHCMNLPIQNTASALNLGALSQCLCLKHQFPKYFTYIDVYVGPHFQNWEFSLNLVEVPPCSDTQLHHLEPKITESLHKLRKVVHVLEILTILLEILITVCWKYWYFC